MPEHVLSHEPLPTQLEHAWPAAQVPLLTPLLVTSLPVVDDEQALTRKLATRSVVAAVSFERAGMTRMRAA